MHMILASVIMNIYNKCNTDINILILEIMYINKKIIPTM